MRNLGLDILRIIAVVLVLGSHFRLPEDPGIILQLWKRGGWVGVDIFFVLSGFLISSLLFLEHRRKGSIDIKRFLVRRGFKIYPAFWLLLIVSLILRRVHGTFPTRASILGELVFLQNYVGTIWGHTWSLAVEEHFYLGIAALFTLIAAIRPRHHFEMIPVVFVVVSTACLLLRLSNLHFFPTFRHHPYLFWTHIRIDSLFFGVFLAYLIHFHNLQNRLTSVHSVTLISIGIVLLSPAFMFELVPHKWVSIFGVVLFYIGSGFLVLAATRMQSSNSRLLTTLGTLGAASYSIYLWHMPVNTWGITVFRRFSGIESTGLYVIIYIVGACAFGWAMNRLIECPVLRCRDYYFPSATSGNAARVISHR